MPELVAFDPGRLFLRDPGPDLPAVLSRLAGALAAAPGLPADLTAARLVARMQDRFAEKCSWLGHGVLAVSLRPAGVQGVRLALATLAAYLVEGAAGLPVFTNGGGLAYFAGPTTGYLAGFVVAAGLTGWAADRGLDRNAFKLFAVNLAGTAIILLLGAAWIAMVFGPEKALAWGVGPFIATDVIKAALAAAVVPAGWQIANLFRR